MGGLERQNYCGCSLHWPSVAAAACSKLLVESFEGKALGRPFSSFRIVLFDRLTFNTLNFLRVARWQAHVAAETMATATAPSASSADLGGSPPPPQPSAASNSTGIAKSRSLQQRKRKRLNAVLDKISNHVNGNYASSNNSENNNETDVVEKVDNMFGRTEQDKLAAASASSAACSSAEESGTSRPTTSGAGPMLTTTSRKNNAALRRELWRDNQQQSVNDDNAVKTFRFDSQDRERYLSGDSMVVNPNVLAVHEEVEHDTFSPGRSPHSSMSSPQVSVESPRICFSPLRIKVCSMYYYN